MTCLDDVERAAQYVRPDLSAEDQARLDRWGRQVGLEMLYGNFERAHELVEQGRRELAAQRGPADVTATPLADCLEERLAHPLEREFGALTIADVLALTPAQILAIPNLKGKMLERLLRQLLAHALAGWQAAADEVRGAGEKA